MHSRSYIPLYFVIFFVTHAVSSTNNGSLENNAAEEENIPPVDLIQDWVISKLEARLGYSQNDTAKLIRDVNNLFGNDILSENGENVQIDFNNLLSFVKLQARKTLNKMIGGNDMLILSILADRKISASLDQYFSQFEEPIKKANFPISIRTRRSQITSPRSLETALVRGIFSSFLGPFLTTIQSNVNQALLSISTELMKLYQPTVPTDFFSSILVSLLNDVITGVVSIIDNVRIQINNALTPPVQPAARALYKRSVTDEVQTNPTRSVLDIILSPLRFIAGLVLAPLRNILTSVITNFFVSLRPVIGGIILGPIESLILTILNFIIPCSTC